MQTSWVLSNRCQWPLRTKNSAPWLEKPLQPRKKWKQRCHECSTTAANDKKMRDLDWPPDNSLGAKTSQNVFFLVVPSFYFPAERITIPDVRKISTRSGPFENANENETMSGVLCKRAENKKKVTDLDWHPDKSLGNKTTQNVFSWPFQLQFSRQREFPSPMSEKKCNQMWPISGCFTLAFLNDRDSYSSRWKKWENANILSAQQSLPMTTPYKK